jgi:hypothetical protein
MGSWIFGASLQMKVCELFLSVVQYQNFIPSIVIILLYFSFHVHSILKVHSRVPAACGGPNLRPF